MKGKQTCKILKEIRKQIAAENDIKLVVEECTYQGDCLGTCPKCEAEVRYLERELEKRQRMGKAAVFAGMSLGTLFAATSCYNNAPVPERLESEPYAPDTTEMSNDTIPTDTIPEDTIVVEGDVLATVPDTLTKEEKKAPIKEEKKASCKMDEPLEIVGDVEEDEWVEGFVLPEAGEVENPETDIFTIVEQMPEFPGGQDSLDLYIKENMRYGEMIRKYQADAIGRIFVNFIVEPDGSISNVRVLRGIYEHYDEEAVRVVKSMPKWNPGMHHGKPVRVSYTIPIVFYWPN